MRICTESVKYGNKPSEILSWSAEDIIYQINNFTLDYMQYESLKIIKWKKWSYDSVPVSLHAKVFVLDVNFYKINHIIDKINVASIIQFDMRSLK